MLNGLRVCVVMPGYNAEQTVERTYEEIPKEVVDDDFVFDNQLLGLAHSRFLAADGRKLDGRP